MNVLRREQLKKLPAALRQVFRYMGRRHVATVAAASAFWVFLSLVPAVILVSSLLPYTSLRQEMLLGAIADYVPLAFQELLRGIVEDVYASSAALLSVSLLLTFWSSGMGFSALIRGLEGIYERPVHSGFLRRRARALAQMAVFFLAVVLAMLIMGLGRSLQGLMEAHFPALQGLFTFLAKLRFGAVQGVLVLIFASLYRWAPGVRLRWSAQLPGAVFAALGWSLFSAAFSYWISLTGGYGSYGRLATVAVVMVWLYYCMTIVLWGACLNRAVSKIKNNKEKET